MIAAGPTSAGHFVLYPGNSAPVGTAVINYQAGRTIANNAFAQLATDGSGTLGVASAGSANLVIDVSGYVSADPSPPAASIVGPLGYVPVEPCRLADTRVEGGALQRGEQRFIGVQGRCGIPIDASAAAINLTATETDAEGYLSAQAGNAPIPASSVLNFDAGSTIANAAETKLGGSPGADLAVEAGPARLQLIVDAQGYLSPDVTTQLRPVVSCRVLDTRAGAPMAGGSTVVVRADACAPPNAGMRLTAAFANITVVSPTALGYLTVYRPGSQVPSTSTLNFSGGEPALGHGGLVALDASGDFVIRAVTDPAARVHVIVDVFAYVQELDAGAEASDGPVVRAGVDQAEERGFHPDKLYDYQNLDSVNLFNGNLVVRLPIGDRYPVGGGLTYGFTLSYNSKQFDYAKHKVARGGSVGVVEVFTETLPNRMSNAGVGWELSLGGRLLSPDDPENNSGGPFVNGARDPLPRWVYVDAAGSEHIFYSQLTKWPASDGSDSSLYSRDSSYMRLRSINAVAKDVEQSDGTVYRFVLTDAPGFGGLIQKKWLLAAIGNQFGANAVGIAYGRDRTSGMLTWLVTDPRGRTQTAYFEPDPSGQTPFGRVHHIDLTATNNLKATWAFHYFTEDDPQSELYRCRNEWPAESPRMYLPISRLSSIDLPVTGMRYSMDYGVPATSEETCTTGGGLLHRLTPPTAGRTSGCGGVACAGVEWEYQAYELPRATCSHPVLSTQLTAGVARRTVYDGTSAPSIKLYRPQLSYTGQEFPVTCSEHDTTSALERHYTYTNTVIDPLRLYNSTDKHYSRTINHFAAFPRQTIVAPGPSPSVPEDRWQDYGLPFDRRHSIASGNGLLYLSREVDDVTVAPSQDQQDVPLNGCEGFVCSRVSNDYVLYEQDGSLFTANDENSDGNDLQRRLMASRTVYPTGGEHYVETVSSEFDGYGHYRTNVSQGGGWAQAGGPRTHEVRYNPANQTYRVDADGNRLPGHSFVPRAPGAPWLLGLYDQVKITEGVPSGSGKAGAQLEEDCFDENTGFLKRRRLLSGWSPTTPLTQNGLAEGNHDVVIVYTRGTAAADTGDIVRMEFYGGDLVSIPAGVDANHPTSLCDLPLPTAGYVLARSFAGGMLATSEWRNADSSVALRIIDNTIDIGGVRATSSTAPDGITTAFSYDLLGRLTAEMPGQGPSGLQSGVFSGWTRYTYGASSGCSVGTPTTCASVTVDQYDGSSLSGSLLRQRRVVFDGLGRPFIDGMRTPDTTDWSDEVTTYDRLGHVAAVTARHTAKTFANESLNFDALGRPQRQRAPDGHSVDIVYSGIKSEQRTMGIARFTTPFPSQLPAARPPITEVSTAQTSSFDAFHRLVRFTENSNGAANEQLNSDYAYDVGGRLVHVTQGQQSRDFYYDSLGLLRGVDIPELSHSGTQATCGSGALRWDVVLSNYDPLGNNGRRCDGRVDLKYVYDRAQRLLEVRRPGFDLKACTDGPSWPCLKKFTYGTGNTPANRSNGKITSASAYNLRRETWGGAPEQFGLVEIAYDYAYDGTVATDGRVSSRTLHVNMATNPSSSTLTASPERFEQTFAYTRLGLPARVDYPTCAFANCSAITPPVRSVVLGYNRGLLTSVNGYAAINYSPNPMVRRVTFWDGTSWQQDPDPSHMVRPYRICEQAAGTPLSADCSGGIGPYAYDGAGNVKEIGTERYVYDPEKRLIYGQSPVGPNAGSYQRYDYDRFGNIVKKSNGTATAGSTVGIANESYLDIPISAASNQLSNEAYDASGNLSSWNNGNVYVYDELNQLSMLHSGNQNWWYLYDADGQRVWSYHPGAYGNPGSRVDHWTLRDLEGKVLRVFDVAATSQGPWTWKWTKDYIYSGSTALAFETPAGRGHFLPDHLGSPRKVVDEFGTGRLHFYYPYGEELTFAAADTEALKFTGHERDLLDPAGQGDDLDYMHARHYSPNLGRFLSIDPNDESAAPTRPQTWNRYAYTAGNPMSRVDPAGMKDNGASDDQGHEAGKTTEIYQGLGVAKSLGDWVFVEASGTTGMATGSGAVSQVFRLKFMVGFQLHPSIQHSLNSIFPSWLSKVPVGFMMQEGGAEVAIGPGLSGYKTHPHAPGHLGGSSWLFKVNGGLGPGVELDGLEHKSSGGWAWETAEHSGGFALGGVVVFDLPYPETYAGVPIDSKHPGPYSGLGAMSIK